MKTPKLNRVSRILFATHHRSGRHYLAIGQPYCHVSSRTHIFIFSLIPIPSAPCFNVSTSSATPPLSNFFFLNTRSSSLPAMDKHPQGKHGEGYDESKKEQEREVNGKASNERISSELDDILPHILNIYGSRATAEDFEIYASNASFEDPLMRAEGVKQIKSAFYSLSKIFSESRIVEYTIKEEDVSPGNKEVLMDNKQYYKFMGKGINMISLIKLHIQDGKIVSHEDWWDKKPLWNRDTVRVPVVGRLTEMTRRAAMLATHALMGFGKDPDQ